MLIFFVLLAFKLWWDYRAKSKGRIINHSLSALRDVLIYIVSAWLLFGWDAGGWILLALGLRWLLFDLFFNLINGWDWNHYGDSSSIDQSMKKLGKWHLIPKILIILMSVVIILI